MPVYFVMLGIVSVFLLIVSKCQKTVDLGYKKAPLTFSEFDFYAAIIAFILIFIAGFRYHVGADYNNYITFYEARKSGSWQSLIKLDEPVFALLCKISSIIYDSPFTMFFLSSLLTIGLYLNTIKKKAYYYSESVFLFIVMGVWAGTFGAIRQCIATAIIFAGHRYIIDRKLIKFSLVVLVAFTFHQTALIMLPIYFLVQNKMNFKNVVLIMCAMFAVYFSYDIIFSVMKINEDYSYITTEVNVFRVLVNLSPIVLLFNNSRLSTEKDLQFYGMLIIINALSSVATSGSAYLARVGIYTEIFVVIALPALLRGYDKYSAKIIRLAVYGAYFLYFCYEVIFSGRMDTYQLVFGR